MTSRRTVLLEPSPRQEMALRTRLVISADARSMLDVGGRPLLWHLLMSCSQQGFNDFVILVDASGEPVKRFLLAELERQEETRHDWRIDLMEADSAPECLRELSRSCAEGSFLLLSGDTISDVPLAELLRFHADHGGLATTMAVRPEARFGRLKLLQSQVTDFAEKSQSDEGWINSGTIVLEFAALDYAPAHEAAWHDYMLARLAHEGQLTAYKHDSFWRRLETLRDQQQLDSTWQAGNAPWQSW